MKVFLWSSNPLTKYWEEEAKEFCEQKNHCRDILAKLWSSDDMKPTFPLDVGSFLDDPFKYLENLCTKLPIMLDSRPLCGSCMELDFFEAIREIQRDLWSKLPVIFDLVS